MSRQGGRVDDAAQRCAVQLHLGLDAAAVATKCSTAPCGHRTIRTHQNALASHADQTIHFLSRDGEVYLISEQHIDATVVQRSDVLSALSHTNGQTEALPFQRSTIEAWVACESKAGADINKQRPRQRTPDTRSWTNVLNNFQVCG